MRGAKTGKFVTGVALSAALFAATSASALADDTSDTAVQPADQVSQPFLAWGDGAAYVLAPNGDFTDGLSGWATSGAAGLTSAGEPAYVTGSATDAALDLPAGSSATSPVTAIAANDPTIRFFTASTGNPSSTLSVAVTFTTLAGLELTLPVDTISADGDWGPSPQMWIAVNLLAGTGTVGVQFTFTPHGAGDWQIDDLYVDPWGRT